jgi:hypothetical protein
MTTMVAVCDGLVDVHHASCVSSRLEAIGDIGQGCAREGLPQPGLLVK